MTKNGERSGSGGTQCVECVGTGHTLWAVRVPPHCMPPPAPAWVRYLAERQQHILIRSQSRLRPLLFLEAFWFSLHPPHPAPSQRRHSDSRSSSGVAHRQPPTCSTLTPTFLPSAPCLPSSRHSTMVPVRLHPSPFPGAACYAVPAVESLVSDLPASLQTMLPTRGPPVSRRVPLPTDRPWPFVLFSS